MTFRDKQETFYTGNIVTQGISGRRSKKRAPDLAIAEHILIRRIEPELNTQLVYTLPDDRVSVFSRFFKTDNEEEAHNPLPKFPSLIAFNSWTQEIVTDR